MRIFSLLTLPVGLLSASLGLAPPAAAQTADLTIDERLERTLPGPIEPLSPDEAILTGREDIVLLEEREFFTVFAAALASVTSNPSLSNTSSGFDTFFSYNTGARVSTEIAETYRVSAELSTFGAQYADNEALEYAGFGAGLAVDRSFGPYTVGTRYGPQVVYDDEFEKHSVTLHRVDLFANRQVALGVNALAAPQVALSAIPADPSDFARVSAELAVPVYYSPAPDWLISGRPQVYVRHYFDFFEQATGETRNDVGGGFALGTAWTPTPWATLSTTMSVGVNRSTLDNLDHEVFTATPSLLLRVTF
ncbi:MAG: hypothetical protein MI920_09745 [Kiloniellales bacterium]|nr:hypothetical protein [Kiloniellales bacterium]